MKEKFKWDKFIIDCFICIFLMILSVLLLTIPTMFIGGFVLPTNFSILGGFRDIVAIIPTFCHIFFFAIWFLLEKNNIIRYKIYKSSFIVVFVLFVSFWWLCGYYSSPNPK